jgi:hypothetical protein
VAPRCGVREGVTAGWSRAFPVEDHVIVLSGPFLRVIHAFLSASLLFRLRSFSLRVVHAFRAASLLACSCCFCPRVSHALRASCRPLLGASTTSSGILVPVAAGSPPLMCGWGRASPALGDDTRSGIRRTRTCMCSARSKRRSWIISTFRTALPIQQHHLDSETPPIRIYHLGIDGTHENSPSFVRH